MKPNSLPRWARLVTKYMDANSLNQVAFACLAESPQGMVSYWRRGLRPIPPKAALAIERNTDGALSRFDLCPKTFTRDSAA